MNPNIETYDTNIDVGYKTLNDLDYYDSTNFEITVNTVTSGYNKYSTFNVSYADFGVGSKELEIVPNLAVVDSARDNAWAINNVKITDVPSIVADQRMHDFYWVIVEHISGPKNKMIYLSYVLVNSYQLQIKTGTEDNIHISVVNYWNSD
jgi:hypothetical protein